MIEKLNDLLKPYNIECSGHQLTQFSRYFELLIESNKKINLTAITDKQEVVIKHFFDSITPAFFYEFSNQKLIDVGAGAGFPSIPLKILFPELRVTLLDSLKKRTNFLNLVTESLKLNNVLVLHGRAEDYARQKEHRATYDIAISRAVARLNVLCELSLPFVKRNGILIALKGTKAEEEIIEAEKAIKELGGSLHQRHVLKLPHNTGERTIIYITKEKDTTIKFPRKAGIPNREPLV